MTSQSDRSALKKKLRDMKKSEEKEQRKEHGKFDAEKEGEFKENARMMADEKSMKDIRCSGKTIRTESLL